MCFKATPQTRCSHVWQHRRKKNNLPRYQEENGLVDPWEQLLNVWKGYYVHLLTQLYVQIQKLLKCRKWALQYVSVINMFSFEICEQISEHLLKQVKRFYPQWKRSSTNIYWKATRRERSQYSKILLHCSNSVQCKDRSYLQQEVLT